MTDTIRGGRRASGGCEDFEAFFRQSFPRVRARAMLLWWDREEAEDAVQEAYLELFRCWNRVGEYDSPEAWVYKVMTQRLGKARRKWLRRRVLNVQPSPSASVEETAHARQVLSALRALPDRQRQVMVLYCLQGMSQQDIAAELGISRSGVAASLLKARRRLAKILDLKVGEDTDGSTALMPAPAQGDRPLSSAPPAAEPMTSLLRHTDVWLTAACAVDETDTEYLLADLRARAAVETEDGERG